LKNILLATFVACLCLTSCSKVTYIFLDGSSPYGIWKTGKGHVIVIPHDGTYVYCDAKMCMQGRTRPEGVTGIVLKDFMTNPATRALREISGEDRSEPDYDFTEMGKGMSDERRKDFCSDYPCVPIGNLDINFRFIKIEDF
jgi:hypothetical protein